MESLNFNDVFEHFGISFHGTPKGWYWRGLEITRSPYFPTLKAAQDDAISLLDEAELLLD